MSATPDLVLRFERDADGASVDCLACGERVFLDRSAQIDAADAFRSLMTDHQHDDGSVVRAAALIQTRPLDADRDGQTWYRADSFVAVVHLTDDSPHLETNL